MKMPTKYNADKFKSSTTHTNVEIDGRWVMARPEGFWGLCFIDRMSAAWDVFTGKADCLYWIKQ